MAKSITKYTVFLSSPADMEEEWSALEEVIRELNITYGNANNCIIELLNWKTHSAPGISETHTQDLIFNDIGNDYDIFLGLLWMRFGTPTQNAGSGTEAEFKKALDRFNSGARTPQILFYFKNTPPSSLTDINIEQLQKVNQFKQNIPKERLLYWEYDTIHNLQLFVRMHIPKRIESITRSPITTIQVNEEEKLVEKEELGLFEYSDQFEALMADCTNSLDKINESTNSLTKEITNKAAQLDRLSKFQNPSKNTITVILKRTAKLMDDYTGRLEVETPILYNSFEEGIKSGINILNLIEDFNSEETIQTLESSKDALFSLLITFPQVIDVLLQFRSSIDDLPRIQKDINSSKRKLTNQLDELISKLSQSQELAIEYSGEIGNKIDKMKLKNISKIV